MRITVNFGEFKSAVTRVRSIGVKSENNPTTRFDCISMRVIVRGLHPFLQLGGIESISYATHIPAVADEDAEVVFTESEFIYVKNELVTILPKLSLSANNRITLVASNGELAILHGTKSLLTIPLETQFAFSPILTGDSELWDAAKEAAISDVSSSVLWVSIPNGNALRWALTHIPSVTGSVYSRVDLPHSAEVVRLAVVDTPDSAPEAAQNQSGRCLRIFGTDDRAYAEYYIPVVRRAAGEKSRICADSRVGFIECDQDVAEHAIPPICITRATAKDAATLFNSEPARLRVEFEHKLDGRIIPSMLTITNGMSLVRIPVVMSGEYSGSQVVAAVFTDKINRGFDHGATNVCSFTPTAAFNKGVARVAALRGVKDRGVLLTMTVGSLTIESDPDQSGHSSESVAWDYNDDYHFQPASVYVEGSRLVAVLQALSSEKQAISCWMPYDRAFVAFHTLRISIIIPTLK